MSEVEGMMTEMPTAAELLDFEARHPGHPMTKGESIASRFGMTEARYYMLLHRAALSREGQAHDAVTAHRVTRLAERRTSARFRPAV